MKRIFLFCILVLGVVLPWACADKGNTPTTPPTGIAPQITATGTQTPGTPTNTPTLAPGAATPTFTPTYSISVPVFQTNYSTSAAPRGMVLNGVILTLAESETTSAGTVSELEEYTGAGTAVLDIGAPPRIGNVIYSGCPAPTPPPPTPIVPMVPSLLGLQSPLGFVNPGGNVPGAWSAVLDQVPGTSTAILYCGYYSDWSQPSVSLDYKYMPFQGDSYGGSAFKNPRAMCADGPGLGGSIYITDTDNFRVLQLSPYEGICLASAIPVHPWYGAKGVAVGGTGVTFASAGVSFNAPYAVACDASGNVWVGDQGYNPSMVMQFTSGATTILESWKTIPGCKVTGLAINPGTGNVYVADSGNNLVEIYSPTGTLLSAFGDPGPGAHEFLSFRPSCIAFSGGYIYVGDINNDYIDVFQ